MAQTQALKLEGVQFPATQVASADVNNLDDYEEGTWTPVIAGSTVAGAYELAATAQGRYQKIGNTVKLWARIVLAAAVTGGGTGLVRISGLPFTMSGTDYTGYAAVVVNGIAFTGSYVAVERVTGGATSTLYMYGVDNAGTQTQVPIGNIGTNDAIMFEMSYTI